MGAQWKHAGRTANASKRGAMIGKIVKEIVVAAKTGGPSVDANYRLRAALEAARKNSVPRDTIERAVKKGSGQTDETVNYETVTYEGFAPHQVPLIVECVTDNKNRTASDVRQLFRNGQLGAIGSVGWMFDKMGIIEATHPDKTVDRETAAIEGGAQNVEPLEDAEVPAGQLGARFFTSPADLATVSTFLTENKWTITAADIGYVPKSYPELTEDQKRHVANFLIEIDDNDDVHRIYAAMK